MSVVAIVLAAGRGERMHAGQNKVFLPLLGHPLLSYCLRIFELLDDVTEIVCVAHDNEWREVENCIAHAGLTKKVTIISGGDTRQASVRAGLAAVDTKHRYVLIHDGARPLLTVSLAMELIEAVKNASAVIPAVPVKDTIKRVAAGVVQVTLNRQELWSVQTPQAFRIDLIKQAYQRNDFATDDASLVEAIHPVKIIQGSYSNIKITTPEDLYFAEILLRKGENNYDTYWSRL